MSTMFDPIKAMMTPDMFNAVGQRLGIPGEMVQKGAEIAIPLLTRGVSMAADTPEGQVQIATVVQEADTGLLGNLSGFLGAFGGDTGSNLLTQLFGDESRVVSNAIKEATGFDIAPIVGMVGPLLLGFLKSTAQKEGMDTNALIKKLKSEARSVERRKGDEAVLVNDVIGKVSGVRELKARFSPTEWTLVRNAPMAATSLVTAASPSSASKTAEEVAAAMAAVVDSAKEAPYTSLIAALYQGGVDDLTGAGMDDPMAIVKQAAALVQQHAPDESRAYNQLLVNAAYAAAEAVKEGGFLGIGGKKVTAEEQAVIDSLTAALGL